ncbi:MAG: arsenate reductase (glutaredoxin) [Flavobacteriaceae bacterium]|nr:arsenate reductase (glutaredoxin) [Flavobacteriaceae bacterium]
MMKIYHNARCSKSRQGLALLQDSNKDFEIIEYLKTPLTEKELTDIIDKLQIEPIELVRKNEAIWKEKYKGQNLSNKQIINAMVDNPKLIERPIVVNGDLAVIGRPLDKIISII